jgi:hypothetical protein
MVAAAVDAGSASSWRSRGPSIPWVCGRSSTHRKAMRFAFRNAGVDCVTVGYKSPGEVDEAIENLNLALA